MFSHSFCLLISVQMSFIIKLTLPFLSSINLNQIMSVNFASLTIQAIADSLGIKLASPEIISFLEKDSEKYIRQIINQANALATSARAYKLSSSHIDIALESKGLPPLLGYDSIPNYVPTPLSVDQEDLFGIREDKTPLTETAQAPITPYPNLISHNLHWTLVEGIYAGKRSSSRSSRPNREMKPIERSVSVPNVSSYQHSEVQRNLSVDPTENKLSDSKKCADDILSGEHQKYFISTINLLRCDTVHSLDVALDMISEEDKMQPLLPYFIQYITGKMTLDLQEFTQMKVLIRFTHALIQNKSMNIPLYAHPLLRIVFTSLLAVNLSNELFPDDSSIRKYAAEALFSLVKRCEGCFPEIKQVIFNSLVKILFNPDTTLNAHYGALLGIHEIGFFEVLLPHFRSYLKMIKFELISNLNLQNHAAEALLQLAKSMLFEFAFKCPAEDKKEHAKNLIDEIDRFTF
ncbi:hypothetical protein TRFO_07757 [Tritrichomonas foetus]|uniref:TATA box binding protein associated factor (TAF) histone-like fold domain-containing protein n=1 Tax=Tritrichomonas foetus TaxID=1144522 RepID=A0A1J4JP08_9EUKA|nr:hypothetical protein TRFO_07757 [Tritrichomonas foetus]|eukprot:OHT00779.1 hypothetical protein TRFO_07757 [Tritrichomonas foetus]